MTGFKLEREERERYQQVFNPHTGRFESVDQFRQDGMDAIAARQKQLAQIDPKIAELKAEVARRERAAQFITAVRTREGDFDALTRIDQRTGFRWREFHGDIADMLKHFAPPRRYVKRFLVPEPVGQITTSSGTGVATVRGW
jgi:hypothetical protein